MSLTQVFLFTKVIKDGNLLPKEKSSFGFVCLFARFIQNPILFWPIALFVARSGSPLHPHEAQSKLPQTSAAELG